MTVDPDRGSILKTSADRRKEPIEAKSLEKLMHSYFSAGNDARAGMSQEKARTSTRWGNMLNYGFQICPSRHGPGEEAHKHEMGEHVELRLRDLPEQAWARRRSAQARDGGTC